MAGLEKAVSGQSSVAYFQNLGNPRYGEKQDLVFKQQLFWRDGKYQLFDDSLVQSDDERAKNLTLVAIVQGVDSHSIKINDKNKLSNVADGFFSRDGVLTQNYNRHDGQFLTGRAAALYLKHLIEQNSTRIGSNDYSLLNLMEDVNTELSAANKAIYDSGAVAEGSNPNINKLRAEIGFALISSDGTVHTGNIGEVRVGILNQNVSGYDIKELSKKHVLPTGDVPSGTLAMAPRGRAVGQDSSYASYGTGNLKPGDYLVLMTNGVREALRNARELEGTDKKFPVTLEKTLVRYVEDDKNIFDILNNFSNNHIINQANSIKREFAAALVRFTYNPLAAGLSYYQQEIVDGRLTEKPQFDAAYRNLRIGGITNLGEVKSFFDSLATSPISQYTPQLQKDRSLAEHLLSNYDKDQLTGIKCSDTTLFDGLIKQLFRSEDYKERRKLINNIGIALGRKNNNILSIGTYSYLSQILNDEVGIMSQGLLITRPALERALNLSDDLTTLVRQKDNRIGFLDTEVTRLELEVERLGTEHTGYVAESDIRVGDLERTIHEKEMAIGSLKQKNVILEKRLEAERQKRDTDQRAIGWGMGVIGRFVDIVSYVGGIFYRGSNRS